MEKELLTPMENLIRQYVISKGGTELFRVQSIDTMRDGGTKHVRTTNGRDFFVSKCAESRTIHTDYPITEGNKLTDMLTIAYLLDRINRYVIGEEKDAVWDRELLEQIKTCNPIL